MRTVLFGLGLALVGCGGITPMSGDYDVTMTLGADTCGMMEDAEDEELEAIVTSIVFNDDGSVVLDGDDSLPCTADGATVTCAFSDTQTADGADYAITQDVATELVWDSNTSFAGFQTMSVSCEGADCSFLEDYGYSFPCSVEWDLLGAMAEDAAE